MITRFLWQGMGRNLRLFVLLVLAIGIVLPLLNLLMPPTSALYVPAWALQLVGKYLCFASLALAVDLVWGYCGILTPGPRRLLRAGRLLHGHVPDAPDRQPRRLRQSDPARLHGVPELQGAALVLVRLRPVLVRRHHGRARAQPAGAGAGLVRLPQPRHRRLSLDHHPGDDLRPAAGLLPQRHGPGRQQRHDRLQGHTGLLRAGRRHARRAVLRLGRWCWRSSW